MKKIDMYNTMSIYKQELIEIDEKIAENDKKTNEAKANLSKIATERANLKRPNFLYYLLFAAVICALAFINIPALIISIILFALQNVLYFYNIKTINSERKRLDEKKKKIVDEFMSLKDEKVLLYNEKNFIIENIKLFEDFVYSNKVPTSEQEEKMEVSKSIANVYKQIRGSESEKEM